MRLLRSLTPAAAGVAGAAGAPGYVATVELRRPPDNFFDVAMIRALADAYQALDEDPACRVIVLCVGATVTIRTVAG